MRKRILKKGMLLLLALAVVLSTMVQSCIPVQGAVDDDEDDFNVYFDEKTKIGERNQRVTIPDPDLFEVTDVTVDNGSVVYKVYGKGDVGITVLNGNRILVGKFVPISYPFDNISEITDKKNCKIYDESLKLTFEGDLDIVLPKVDTPDTDGKYQQKYSGYLTNPEVYYYNYIATIHYTKNKTPEIDVKTPMEESFVGKTLDISYTVNDENVDDKLDVFYSIDDESKGTLLRGGIISNGSEQTFNDRIDIDPAIVKENDPHKLYVWVVDKNRKKSGLVIRNFTADYTAPKEPSIELSPSEYTNKSVKVVISYTEDGLIKEIRVDGGEWKPFDKDTGIELDKNCTLETRATDKAGNSTITQIAITNIDKNKPTAPIIAASPAEVSTSNITVTIMPGKDEESGIKTTEYKLSGATNSEWKKYDTPLTITTAGDTVISARSFDNAGNFSESTKTVTIKSISSGDSGISNPGNPGNSGPVVSTVPSNVQVTPTPTAVVTQSTPKIPGSDSAVDLAVYLTSDKTTYGENETINFTIYYRNNAFSNALDTVIRADIPPYTTVLEGSNGIVKGSQIEWSIGNIGRGVSGKIDFKVKVGLLDKAEIELKNKAVISSSMPMDKTDDDESFLRLMLYSNRYDKKSHQLYIIGYKDNTFKPENNITRAEAAAMLVRVLNLGEDTPDRITYKDFTDKHWAYGYIYSATKYGLFEGYKDNSFKPDNCITRAELCTALARYLKLKNILPQASYFSDLSNHWAKNYIGEIYRLKLIEGYKDGNFMPDKQIKRCETVTIINRMLFRGPLKGIDTSFTDVKKTHWAYGHIVESCLNHFYTKNTDGSETKVNK